MSIKIWFCALAWAAASTTAMAQALPPPVAMPGDSAEDMKLRQLFYDSDEAAVLRQRRGSAEAQPAPGHPAR
jgi:hypothetical protein